MISPTLGTVDNHESGSRAVSPVVGVVLLVAMTVLLATTLLVSLLSVSFPSTQTATFDLTAESETNELTITHVAGDDLEVETLTIQVVINDEKLRYQPPVPFVGATGFNGTPSGPLNANAAPSWRAGEESTLELAASNSPTLDSGDEVTVTVTSDGHLLDDTTTTAA